MIQAARKTAKEWSSLLARQRSSGKKPKAWCDEHGINLKTFHNWLYKLKREKHDNVNVMHWVELKDKETSPASFETVSSPVIEVSVGSYTVKVKAGFDPKTFSDICRSLSELC
jgi:hypothetical protein